MILTDWRIDTVGSFVINLCDVYVNFTAPPVPRDLRPAIEYVNCTV